MESTVRVLQYECCLKINAWCFSLNMPRTEHPLRECSPQGGLKKLNESKRLSQIPDPG